MKKNNIYGYLGWYFATNLKVPFKNRQGKLMFYGDNNSNLRLINVINDDNLKQYSNNIAARICLKHILDNYFIAVRPNSDLDYGYSHATEQSTGVANLHMVTNVQMRRKKVTIRQGNYTEILDLPSFPMKRRKNYVKELKAAKNKIVKLKAKLHAKKA